MKKVTILLAACNLFFMVGCGSSEKKPGEEYYDPNYKPQTNQSAAGATNNTNNAGTTTNAAADNATAAAGKDTTTAAAKPVVTEPQASGTKVEGAPPSKDEVVVGVQPKDKLQSAPVKSFEKGKTLISKSDCLACHKDDAKLVGPAYVDVANKYENTPKNVDFLVGKIIKGGAGSWGEIPMSPHPNLSNADAREMVNYILSLKK